MKRAITKFEHLERAAERLLSRIDPAAPCKTGNALTPRQLWEAARDYFDFASSSKWSQSEVIRGGDLAGDIVDVPISTPLTIDSFCIFAGIGKRTFARYLGDYVDKKDTPGAYDDYIEIANFIRDIIQSDQLEGALVGAYDPRISASILGLAEKKELTGKDGGAIEIEQIKGMIIK